MFRSVRHIRFLQHLIGHHSLLNIYNSIMGQMFVPMNSIGLVGKHICLQVGIFSCYIKPSCIPNVYVDESEGFLTVKTIRPVKKGEYLQGTFFMLKLLQSKEARQKHLWDHRRLNCKCPRCNGLVASLAQRQQILDDPDYHYISYEYSVWQRKGDVQTRKAIAEKCVDFLNRHGHIMWCDELGKILFTYLCLVRSKSTNMFDMKTSELTP